MRPIDAESFKAQLIYFASHMQDNGYSTYAAAVGEVISILDRRQTIDAVPVVHARWIKDDIGNSYCSNCDGRLPYIRVYDEIEYDEWDEEIDQTPWCMFCGARMDGDAECLS